VPIRLPRRTRIILIPEDEGPSREYSIDRVLVLVIGGLLLLLLVLIVAMLFSYRGTLHQSRQVPRLEQDLAEAQARLETVDALALELEQMRSLQEKLLVMLGVEPPGVNDGDTLAAAAGRTPILPGGTGVSSGGAGIPVGAPTAGTGDLNEVARTVVTPPPSRWPVAGFVTREFRTGDTPQGILPHHGIDLAAPLDTPVRAAGEGRVLEAGWDDYLGNYVEIQHGFGYVTVYGHCNRLFVSTGEHVEAGQVIAYLGGTGQASAPHLHFEVWKDGEVVDPRTVIPGDPPR
jgi:murein DD-endopeptidase MepM/ murein hydrolase activator NlpD